MVSWRVAPEDAASFVYIIALCFISSSFGRIGADHIIPANAFLFRHKNPIKAASLFYFCIGVGLVLGPAAATTIHYFVVTFSTANTPQVGFGTVIFSTAFFATAQTTATTLQTMGRTIVPVVVFPFMPYCILATVTLWAPKSVLDSVVLAFAVPSTIGMLQCSRVLKLQPQWLSLQWIRKSTHYHLLDINFYANAWAPFIYLHMLLAPSEIVVLNLAMRISSLQSMPANAVGAWVAPQFAINFRIGNTTAVESIFAKVILFTLLFQIVYVAFLSLLYFSDLRLQGVSFDQLELILIVLSAGQLVNGLTGPVGPALLMAGNLVLMTKTSWIISVATNIAGIVLAWTGGALAFSVGLSASIILQNLLYANFLYSRAGIDVSKIIMSLLTRSRYG